LRLRLSHGSKELCSEFPEEQEVRVAQVLHSARSRYPEIFQQWYDKEGHIRKSLPVFVNGVHIRYLQGMDTELKKGDEVYVIPLIAGG
jgi:molybdopterin converting factor small subunit